MKYFNELKITLDSIIQGEKFERINDINIFYRHTHDVNDFFKNTPKEKFILVSHNSDGKITNNPGQYDADIRLMPDNLIMWYGQNVNYKHDKIKSIPIGLENSKWFPQIRKTDKILNKLNEEKKLYNLVYMNHNIRTNITERSVCYSLLNNKPFVTTQMGQNGYNFDNYIDNIYNHKFVICPEGNGIDTHRTWETLYLGSIPIEKVNINNSFYNDLPICFVDEWGQITEDFLNKEYNRIMNTKWNLDKLDIFYWQNEIYKL